MAIVQVSVNVEQATLNVGLGLAQFVGDVKKALASGSVPAEIAAVAIAALGDLLPLVNQLAAVKQELGENVEAEINTAVLVGSAIIKAVLS